MKRLFIITSLALIAILSSIAQTVGPQIEGFWGVRLGDSESVTTYKVKQSYPSAEYKNFTYGKRFCANDVSLAGISPLSCEIKFTDGIFTEAEFRKGYSQLVEPGSAQSYVNSILTKVESDYQDICDALSRKYGVPKISGERVTWRTSNGNSIIVEPYPIFTPDVPFVKKDQAGLGSQVVFP